MGVNEVAEEKKRDCERGGDGMVGDRTNFMTFSQYKNLAGPNATTTQ